MTILLTASLIALLPLIHFASASPEPPSAAPAPAPGTTARASDYIRTSCETTLYPELCYRSLFGYANAVQKDPARLARVAVGVSLSRARHMADYLANISGAAEYGGDGRASAAVHDCFSVFGDAVEQIRGSLKKMRRLNGTGEELRFQMSDVQTWMSAALTNEDTCTDGFEDVEDGPLKTDVCDRTVKVKEVTSNALALVNSYAAKVVAP
ncbi:21 kDa protein-like [Andrographis paniculata]|uniref:21 kDa protein-like n=1 Tax=Andrographis paniculata TaxID=175694 RepID=UPI0021E7C17A|nr:21 kDa protein-like [Andrographis paniculata]